jgi:hypothetical protein
VCIKYKWLFDIKRDGTFHARLVACRYSQVPGVDFKESYSPVINVVFQILIVCQIIWGLTAVVVDVEVGFKMATLTKLYIWNAQTGLSMKPMKS